MRRYTCSIFIVFLAVILARPVFGCGGLYLWFDRVFGYESTISPLYLWTSDLSSRLDDLPGYVILGTEVIDRFRGCRVGRMIQFESGNHVTCNELGFDSEFDVDAVLLARPHPLGDDQYICNFQCKMIVSTYLSQEVFDVSCEDYMADMYGPESSSGVLTLDIPEVPDLDLEIPVIPEIPEIPTVPVMPSLPDFPAPPPPTNRVDLGQWNWVYDLPGGPDQATLDMIYEMGENCKIAESKGWPSGYFEIRPGELALISRSMCQGMGDIYP